MCHETFTAHVGGDFEEEGFGLGGVGQGDRGGGVFVLPVEFDVAARCEVGVETVGPLVKCGEL